MLFDLIIYLDFTPFTTLSHYSYNCVTPKFSNTIMLYSNNYRIPLSRQYLSFSILMLILLIIPIHLLWFAVALTAPPPPPPHGAGMPGACWGVYGVLPRRCRCPNSSPALSALRPRSVRAPPVQRSDRTRPPALRPPCPLHRPGPRPAARCLPRWGSGGVRRAEGMNIHLNIHLNIKSSATPPSHQPLCGNTGRLTVPTYQRNSAFNLFNLPPSRTDKHETRRTYQASIPSHLQGEGASRQRLTDQQTR